MQVVEILNKITERNAPVIGCIAQRGDRMYQNLGDFGLDCAVIADKVSDLIMIAELLGTTDSPIETIITEYDGHSLIAQQIGEVTLISITEHLPRAGFKKLQVGLSLQTRMLGKAFDTSDAPETPVAAKPEPRPAEVVSSEPKAEAGLMGTLSSLVSSVGSKPAEGVSSSDEPPPGMEGKKRRVYRGQVFWE